MPAQPNSRYRTARRFIDDKNRRFIGVRRNVQYVDDPGNRIHIVKRGETLESIAHKRLPGFGGRSSDLYWILAEFQPNQILDPTQRLQPGQVIVIPSEELVGFILGGAS